MPDYALRFDVSFQDAPSFIDALHSKYLKNIKSYLWTKEIAKETKKEHIHGFVSCDEIKKSTIRDFIRKQSFYKDGCYSIQTVKDITKYKNYIVKDMKILMSNLREDELDHLIDEAQRIDYEKKVRIEDRLLEWLYPFIDEDDKVELYDNNTLLDKILEYFIDRKNKGYWTLMPTRNQMFQYVSTIQARLGNKVALGLLYHNIV